MSNILNPATETKSLILLTKVKNPHRKHLDRGAFSSVLYQLREKLHQAPKLGLADAPVSGNNATLNSARLAQLVEQWTENPRVPGSSPGPGNCFDSENLAYSMSAPG